MVALTLDQKQIDFIENRVSFLDESFDLNTLCGISIFSSFFLRVSGDSMVDAAIFEGDVIHVNRGLEALHGDIVIASINGEFTVKYLNLLPSLSLEPRNKMYPTIKINDTHDFEIFGVVVSVIRKLR